MNISRVDELSKDPREMGHHIVLPNIDIALMLDPIPNP